MKLRQWRALCLVALLVSGISTQVTANSSQSFYAGVGLGLSNYGSLEDLYPDYEGYTDVSVDDSPIGFQLFAGWEVVPRYLAIEFSYANFGAAEITSIYKEVDGGNEFVEQEYLDVTTSAFGVALKGLLPLGESLSLFGKLGYASWEVDAKFRYEGYFNGVLDSTYSGTSDNLDGNDFFYSIGAEYHYSKNLSFFAEYLMQEAVLDESGMSFEFFEASTISAGISWRFDSYGRRSGRRGSGAGDDGKRNLTACDERFKEISGILCGD